MKKIINRIILLVTILLLSINSTFQFLYYQNGKKFDTIKIEGVINNKDAEIKLSKFNINGENFNLSIFSNNDSYYDTDNYSLNFKSNFSIEKKMSIFSDYSISFYLNKGDKISFFINGEKKQDIYGDNINNIKEIQKKTSVIDEVVKTIKTNVKVGICILFVFIVIYYLLINKIGIPLIKKLLEGKTDIKYIILYSVLIFITIFINCLIWFAISKVLLIILAFVILASEYLLFRKMIVKNVLYIYIAFIIPVSILFGFIVLPFSVPDEASHLYKSFMVSDNIMGANNTVEDKSGGYTYVLPNNVYEYVNNYTQELSSTEYVVKPKNILLGGKKIENNKKSKKMVYVNSVKYLYDLTYIPSALVLTAFRIINLDIIPMFYLSRYINLLLAHILIVIAIKNIPRFKKIILLTSSLPIMLQQSNAINQDWITNALYIFIIYLITSIKFSNKKDREKISYYIQTLIAGILICFCKMGYFLAIYLLFLWQNRTKKNNSKKIEWIIILLVSGCFIFTMFNSYSANVISTGKYDINYLIHNPIKGVILYFNTFIMKGDYLLFRGLFDNFYYSTKSHLSIISFIMQLIFMFLIFTSKQDEEDLSLKNKITLLIISFLQIVIIFTAMLSCSPIGDPFISGLQARYFIPVFVLLLFALPSNIIKYISKLSLNKVWALMIFIVEFLSIFTIVTKSFI